MSDWHQCPRCKAWYPPHLETAAFPRISGGRAGCLGCVRIAEKDYTSRRKWRKKAHSIIRNHARSLGITREELIHSYGWNPDVIAGEAETAYSQPCPYCNEAYEDEGSLTLDIIHIEQAPFWRANTQWTCAQCNSIKHLKGTVEFARQMQVMEIFSGKKTFLPPENALPAPVIEELRLFDDDYLR